MRKLIQIFLMLAMVSGGAGALLHPLTARAQTSASEAQALVVIRFNQPRVYFDQQLFSALSKALAVKPDVVFRIVSYAPVTGNDSTDARWQEVASRNTQSVLASMKNMGVPADRIEVSGQQQSGLRFDETHVFVR
jgi:hypothetical protein